MTGTPDPKTVRDFARRAILSSAEDVDYIGIGEQFGDEEGWPQGDSLAYDAMHDAVYDAIGEAIVTVSWPDEQPPAFAADPDTPAGCIDVWLTAWKRHYGDLGIPFGASLIAGPPPSAEPRASADDFGAVLETLAAVLTDRARTAMDGQPTAEQDGDVRAVDAMLVAYVRDDADEIREAFDSLRDRFIRRIAELEVRDTRAALDARDADGSAS